MTAETNMEIIVDSVWRDVDSLKINIGDVWRDVTEVKINISDVWKTIFTSEAFVFEAKTTGDDETFTLPIYNGGAYDFNVDWGDGNDDDITAWDDAAVTHTYASADTYTVIITGTITGWRFANAGDKTKIYDISSWGPLLLGDNNGYFFGCSNLTVSAIDILDTSAITTMLNAFFLCSSLTTVPSMDDWDMSGVTTVGSMFNSCTLFNQDISGWDTSSMTNMGATFQNCSNFNQDIGGWDTSKVTGNGFYRMFRLATSFDQDLGGWDVTSLDGAAGATQMFLLVTLSVSNWDALLVGWEGQAVHDNITLDGGDSRYTAAPSAAATARQALIDDHNWTITDGGEHYPSGSPVGWWKADAITGLEDNDPVGTWPDQSGNEYDLIQADGGKKPLYKTNIQNGLPGVLFDKIDDTLYKAYGTTYNQPCTVFAVTKCIATNHTGIMFDGSGANRQQIAYISDDTYQLYAGTALGGGTTGTTCAIHTGLYNGASSTLRVNEVEILAGNAGAAGSESMSMGDVPGAGVVWNGYIFEIVYYDGNEDPTDNEVGLNTKYAVHFVPSGSPTGWYSADGILGLEDNDPVGTWLDLSGNGNHLTQAITDRRPTYQTNEQNGLPVVRFDGVDDSLYSEDMGLEQPETVFAVFKHISRTGSYRNIWDGYAATHMLLQEAGANNLQLYAGAALDVAYTLNECILITGLYNGESSLLRRDGWYEVSGDIGSYDGDRLTIGGRYNTGTYCSNIDMAEFIIYNNNEAYTYNESGLNAKYNIHWESDWDPSGSPIGWWPANCLEWYGLEDNDPVGTWPDQSGNSYDLVQAVGGNKPTYKINILNGHPVVRFDGGDWLSREGVWSVANEEYTFFSVIANQSILGGGATQALWDQESDRTIFCFEATGAVKYHDSVWQGTQAPTADDQLLTFIMKTVNDGSIRRNGAEIEGSLGVVTRRCYNTKTLGANQAGSAWWFNGDIAEAIIYLNAEDPTANEAGLNTKYDVYWEPDWEPSGSPVGWWPANCLGWYGLEDNDPVGTWPDQSGNGNDMVQAVAGKKPLYKVDIQNGKPALWHDAVDDGLEFQFDAVTIYTFYVVYNCTDESSVNRRAIQSGVGNTLVGPFDGKHQYFNTAFIAGPDITADEFIIACCTQTDTPSDAGEFIVNNVSQGTNANAGSWRFIATGAEGTYVNPLSGYIAEVIYYDSKLADTETTSSGLNTKYSIY